MVVLSSATSAISVAARASSLAFLASPISFEAELRRACACSDFRIAAISVFSLSTTARGVLPGATTPYQMPET